MGPKASTSTGGNSSFSLPAFLKLLTAPNRQRGVSTLTMSQAMAAAAKLVPAGYTTVDKIKALTQADMSRLGIADEDVRKGLMALSGRSGKAASPGKRKRGSDLDRPLPTSETKEVVQTDFDFEEIHHTETLSLKSCVVNRAPVMTAWATVVAERLGFKRAEALSIAQVFTDLNASSKGVSLGILPPSSSHANAGTSQPYVDLLGRRVPVLTMQDGEWRGITKGAVAEPAAAFGYLQRGFRQQLGAVVGALRVLADSFEPEELNKVGFGLYADFRPESDGGAKGWGQKAEMKMSTILELRRFVTHGAGDAEDGGPALEVSEVVKDEDDVVNPFEDSEVDTARKKPRLEPGDDEDDGFGGEDVDWASVPLY